MKILIAIFIITIFFSCRQNTESTQPNSPFLARDITDNKDIFGDWKMCATSDSSFLTQMNTCIPISFKYDGTGSVEVGSFPSESFIWTLKNFVLKIMYWNKPSNATFPDLLYTVSFYKETDVINLTIRHGDNLFYLTKQINPK